MLIVSNGTAEDLIGAKLAAFLRSDVLALPLVGEGRAYASVAHVLGPPLALPSGGFPFASFPNLRADLAAGLIGTSFRQLASGARAARSADVVVSVGDAYALLLATLASGAGRPLVQLQPLVTVRYAERLTLADHLRELNALGANVFLPPEVALQRRAWSVFTRDEASAAHLRRRGVAARYLGSFAMDVLPEPERDLSVLLDDRPVLALLPGSRGDAISSLPIMLEAAARLRELRAVVAWAGPLSALPDLPGWTTEPLGDAAVHLSKGGATVTVLRGAFGSVARAARFAIGTAGTASEQLAGLGVPVVAFPTLGPQFVATFARRQKRLLGEALTLVDAQPNAVADAVRRFVTNDRAYDAASRAGRERIGAGGALERIARDLDALSGAR
ncbi:uncharacterized protein (TIGR03492 family) [Deinococcus yavapaiensis KR-236]|uniref:Uncharacterized protein (TIGR03492 family) n=1 Tax=Deinococcus yavapaiensis KR-236 TaxID=694435 RepID=A0A318S9J4_9DEIO|nr:uncharacterized protein (TIGR03492 family) [Deinococcus yavapaiensis KR-236]